VSSNTQTMPSAQGTIVITPTVRGYSVRRYYDPGTGQFISLDPAVDQTEAPYAYVAGDPVSAIDPLGLGCGLLSPGDCFDDAANAFLGGTTAIGNAIANSPIAQPFLSVTTDIGSALGGAYYDFASAHPCIAQGISATVQIAGLFFFPEEAGLEELAGEGSDLALSSGESWGNPATLEDHFLRHGADFGATSAENYASQASSFLQRGLSGGAEVKVDSQGVIRVYDPATDTFGSYNADGTTRTFYRPDPAAHGYPTNQAYWNAQPGSAP
jgi:RHS repeat-associated protein